MYNKFLKIKENHLGKCVVTSIDIPAKSPILEMRGDRLSDISHLDPTYCLQVGNSMFLGPSGDIDDFINHSCNPNCYLHIVGSRAILYSLYEIKANSELTFDYSLSSTDTHDSWSLACKCGDPNCRKTISGFQYLDENVKDRYKKLGIIPIFISEKPFKGE